MFPDNANLKQLEEEEDSYSFYGTGRRKLQLYHREGGDNVLPEYGTKHEGLGI